MVTSPTPFLYGLDNEKKAQTEELAMIMIENVFSKQKDIIEDMIRERSGSNERFRILSHFDKQP